MTLSQNDNLGCVNLFPAATECDRESVMNVPPCGHRDVLLLLLGDADPPTLLETSR